MQNEAAVVRLTQEAENEEGAPPKKKACTLSQRDSGRRAPKPKAAKRGRPAKNESPPSGALWQEVKNGRGRAAKDAPILVDEADRRPSRHRRAGDIGCGVWLSDMDLTYWLDKECCRGTIIEPRAWSFMVEQIS